VASVNPLQVVRYNQTWPHLFEALGGRIRVALGDIAIRIDHIGSTSVVGLDAKPIIDVQISVAALEPVDAFRPGLGACGFVWRSDNPELTKRCFREQTGQRRTHLHVRRSGSFDEQLALLFRDYLRTHPDSCATYAAVKHSLAHLLVSDRTAYVDGKEPFIWDTLRQADRWAQNTGWEPGPTDA
jgi:GrpB-like predicted nucleotidyltransferase (UPF0157 family)